MHIMELLGKSKVKVEHEMVQEASEPLIEWCLSLTSQRNQKGDTTGGCGEYGV